MSGFIVDIDALAATATALEQLRTVMSEWDQRKPQLAGAADRAGHGTVADAIQQFCDEWDHGFGLLADDIENLITALDHAAATYTDTEAGIISATQSTSD